MRISEKYPVHRYRRSPLSLWNTFSTWLSTVLGDIADRPDDELLRECYCDDRERKDFDEYGFPEVVKEIFEDFKGGRDYGPPIIIYGPVGCGKSTYIHHLLRVKFPERFEFPVVPFFLDFRKVEDTISTDRLVSVFHSRLDASLRTEFPEFAFETQSVEQLRTKATLLEEVFKERLARFEVIYSEMRALKFEPDDIAKRKLDRMEQYVAELETYNLDRVRYLQRKRGTLFVFVFDNIDHQYHSEEFQKVVFGLARMVMAEFASPAVIPMRTYTAADAYDIHGYTEAFTRRTLSLSAPKATSLLKLRRDYVIKHLPRQIDIAIDSGKWKRTKEDAERDIRTIIGVYLEDPAITEFLCRASGYDMRMLLEIITNTLASGYFGSGDREELANVSYDRFLKATLYGNNWFHRPEDRRTSLISLLDNDGEPGYENMFVRVRVLQYLNYVDSPVPVRKLIQVLETLGYREEITQRAIAVMEQKGLFEVYYYHPRRGSFGPHDKAATYYDKEVRISQIGKFYLESLLADWRYIELIVPSTNLPPRLVHQIEGDVSKKPGEMGGLTKAELQSKYAALTAFIAYLKDLERAELDNRTETVKAVANEFVALLSEEMTQVFSARYYHI